MSNQAAETGPAGQDEHVVMCTEEQMPDGNGRPCSVCGATIGGKVAATLTATATNADGQTAQLDMVACRGNDGYCTYLLGVLGDWAECGDQAQPETQEAPPEIPLQGVTYLLPPITIRASELQTVLDGLHKGVADARAAAAGEPAAGPGGQDDEPASAANSGPGR